MMNFKDFLSANYHSMNISIGGGKVIAGDQNEQNSWMEELDGKGKSIIWLKRSEELGQMLKIDNQSY